MTLKANELRIGNYVKFDNHEDEYYIITGCDISELSDEDIDLIALPIPLTEEWLINLGAFKFDNKFIFDRFRLKYRPDYKFYYVTCKETNAYITKVEFVHEWQNVVFALNNQELTLKNNSNN